MNILVTAGNTLVPIDRVRCITNVFTGRTGAEIALAAHARAHRVLLLTSQPEVITAGEAPAGERWHVVRYRTFEDLSELMEVAVREGMDAVVHCAAVSDYLSGGIFAPAAGTHFQAETGHWATSDAGPPALVDRTAAKVKSDDPELWLRLVRAPKLIDLLRSPWGFKGVLVKFKLEAGITQDELVAVAERSRKQSNADLMVANSIELLTSVYLGPRDGHYERFDRRQLPTRLLDAVERLHSERSHG
jgi:phosphopantothenoylcysteine synthetase/decarboxylase